MMARLQKLVLLLLLLAWPAAGRAAPSPFDLMGPSLRVTVAHAGQSLPIADVPNLAEGDQLTIRAELPKGQSVHYLLVVAFLQGATNPPPESWFFQSETWSKKGPDGLTVTTPKDAQQVLVFLAPQTGGDFKTIMGAVRARPGAFVRASQDLNRATLDRSRLNVFLAAVREASRADPASLKTISPLLARSLTIKLDPDCLQRALEEQAACITHDQDALVLDDGHSSSIVQALTSGYSADLVQALSATPQAGAGYYSPYVASVLDIAHLLDSFHTAKYQYIPTLGVEAGDQVSLLLNAPPSFQNPKSVLVAALPAVEPVQIPPLHLVDAETAACIEQPALVLPVEGAPLVFSMGYAHDLVLRLKTKTGHTFDLPVAPDPRKGGLVVDTARIAAADFGPNVEGALHGAWGFASWDGPRLRLQSVQPGSWRAAPADEQALIAGRTATVRLQAQAAACVRGVTVVGSSAAKVTAWKPAGSDALDVDLDLKAAQAGELILQVQSYGAKAPEPTALRLYAPVGRFDGFTLHAADTSGQLRGADLDEVQGLELGGATFLPDPAASAVGVLSLTVQDSQLASKIKSGPQTARISLKDGRTIPLTVSILPPRPQVSLIGKSIDAPPADAQSQARIQLTDPDEAPSKAVLTFSIRAQGPSAFSGATKVEVATVDGAFTTTLTPADGLVLQDAHVAVARLDTARAFGASAFGPLRFRVVDGQGTSDWQPLATLVRLPSLIGVACPEAADQPCRLSGGELFLISALADNAEFAPQFQAPDGFPGSVLPAPHPRDGRLYMRLRDDPAAANLVLIPPVQAAAPSPPAG